MCPHGKLWHCFCFSNAALCLCSIVHTTTRQAQGISLSCVAASCDSLVVKQWATLSASNTVQYFSKFAIKLFLLKVEITLCFTNWNTTSSTTRIHGGAMLVIYDQNVNDSTKYRCNTPGCTPYNRKRMEITDVIVWLKSSA